MRAKPESAVAYTSFRWYLLAIAFGTFAIQIQGVAVAWHVYELTHDPLALGAIGLAEVIPFVSSVLFAGHVADTNNRRTVSLITLSLMTLLGLFLLIPDVVSDFRHPLALVYTVVTLGGVARSFLTTSRQAMIAEILPKELLGGGVRWRNTVFELACVIGPAMAGGLWALGGARVAYATMTVFFLFSLGATAMIRTPRALHLASREPVLRSLHSGVQFLLNKRLLLGTFTLDLFAVLFGGAVALLPIFAGEILHVGSVGLGLLRAAPSVGAVLTSLVLIALPPLRRAGPSLYASFAVFGLCIIGFGFSTSFALSLFLLFVSGGADAVNVIIRQTILQTGTPPEMMGRVSAVTAVFVGCSNELGTFESGLAARLFGTVNAVVFGGLATFGVMGVTAWRFPEIWKLRRITPDEA